MNLRQIEGFCVLAKTLNFSKAAEKLYITQPAFSRMIESLENELGCKLIVRNRTEPRLTPAGEALLPSMQRIAREYQNLIALARGQTTQNEELSIGLLENGFTDRARQLLRLFQAERPAMRLRFREISEAEVFELLLAGKLDCAIVAHFPQIYRDSLRGQVLERYRICAVVSRDHPLAERASVSPRELKDESFILIDEEKSSLGYQSIMSLCLKNGFSPKLARKESSVSMALSAVDLGYGVMILSDSMQSAAGSHCVFLPLEGVEEGKVWLVSSASASSPVLQELTRFLDRQEEA